VDSQSQLHIVICLTYFQDENELINMKVEEVTYVQEEDPLAVTFPAVKAEQEVGCISVCPAFTDVQLFHICYQLTCHCLLALVVKNPLQNVCNVLYFVAHMFCRSTLFCVVTVFEYIDPLEY
jgi:hypothetical protein